MIQTGIARLGEHQGKGPTVRTNESSLVTHTLPLAVVVAVAESPIEEKDPHDVKPTRALGRR